LQKKKNNNNNINMNMSEYVYISTQNMFILPTSQAQNSSVN